MAHLLWRLVGVCMFRGVLLLLGLRLWILLMFLSRVTELTYLSRGQAAFDDGGRKIRQVLLYLLADAQQWADGYDMQT